MLLFTASGLFWLFSKVFLPHAFATLESNIYSIVWKRLKIDIKGTTKQTQNLILTFFHMKLKYRRVTPERLRITSAANDKLQRQKANSKTITSVFEYFF